MKTLIFCLLFVSVNACAASSGGGWVVGNPILPTEDGVSAQKAMKKIEKEKDCVCKDAKATPPCECKVPDAKGEGAKEKDAGKKAADEKPKK